MHNDSASHLRSLIFAPVEIAYGTSYFLLIVTLVLSCPVSEILELLYAESHFKYPTSIVAKILKISLEVTAKSEHPRITNGEIIFEVFQPICVEQRKKK